MGNIKRNNDLLSENKDNIIITNDSLPEKKGNIIRTNDSLSENKGNIIRTNKSKEEFVYEIIKAKFNKQIPLQGVGAVLGPLLSLPINLNNIKNLYIPLFDEVRKIYVKESSTLSTIDILKPVIDLIIKDILNDISFLNFGCNIIVSKNICWIIGLGSAYLSKNNIDLNKDNFIKIADIVRSEMALSDGIYTIARKIICETDKIAAIKKIMLPPPLSAVKKFLETPKEKFEF